MSRFASRFFSGIALLAFVLASTIAGPLHAQAPEPATTQARNRPLEVPPTLRDVAYGPHPKQVLDFYQAKSDTPTPVVIYIHGGGFTGGSKWPASRARLFLAAGISLVSVEYRFIQDAQDVQPPIKACLTDCARAVQFVRSKATEWNIDKTRVAAFGGSAGGFTSLWLAYHDDMADPTSTDPVARESTRLLCAAGDGAQTTLDPQLIKAWIPNLRAVPNLFGVKTANAGTPRTIDDGIAQRAEHLPWIQAYSPLSHVSKDDPPVLLVYGGRLAMGQPQPDPLHNPNWGMPLSEKCQELGVECHLYYDGVVEPKYRNIESFLIGRLKKGS